MPSKSLAKRADGEKARPWLTVIIDDYSRAIAGFFISFDSPSAARTALALRQAIEVRLFHQGKFLCRAICSEFAGETVALRDIKRARDQRRRDLRDTLRDRRKTVEALLELRRGSPPAAEPIAARQDETKPVSALKRYRNE